MDNVDSVSRHVHTNSADRISKFLSKLHLKVSSQRKQ